MNSLGTALERQRGNTLSLLWGPFLLPTVHLRPGELVVVIGGTGVGKSAFALSFLLQLRMPGVLYSLDTDLATQGSRAVSAITGRPETDIRPDPRGWGRVLERRAPWLRAYEKLDELRPKDLWKLLVAEEELWGVTPAAIVVDNVSDIAGTTGYEAYADCFVDLTSVATRTKSIVVALNHVSKNTTGRVTLYDSLYAGASKASLVLGLTKEETGLWCSVLKNRNGNSDPRGNHGVMLKFNPSESMRVG